MRHYRNTCTDPSFNMAFDELMLTGGNAPEGGGCAMMEANPGVGADEIIFGLWQNKPSVIIGYNQVAEQEVNLEYARTHGIEVVRRSTGGGAVYHDLGNLNFSFFIPVRSTEESYQLVFEILREAFGSLGLEIEKSPTNDLWLEGRKFSGMAQKVHAGRMLVHGTILYDVDFDELARVLDVPGGKFSQKRGVASRHAEVVNLKPFLPGVADVQDLARRLEAFLVQKYNSTELPVLEAFWKKVWWLGLEKYCGVL